MKKILKMLLLLVLMIPVMVFADVAVPETLNFKVEVKKSDGVDYYDYKSLRQLEPIGKLPKGTTLDVNNQINEDGEEYLGAPYKDKYIYVKATDVVAKGELDVKDKLVSDLAEPMKVKIKGEVILRKGPSSAHEESGRLENVETTYEYIVYSPTYIYINYKGEKGWLDILNENVSYDGADYVLTKALSNSCGTIPAGHIFENVWKQYPYDAKATVEYKGCKFNITTDSPGVIKISGTKKMYEVKTSVEFYEHVEDDDLITIKKGENITVLSEIKGYRSLYYVEYNGKKGFVTMDLDNEAKFVKDVKEKKERDDDDDEEPDSSSVVIICVVVGLAVAFGALGIILYLANKGKKEVKDEKNA